MNEISNEILTVNQFADYINVHPNTVRSMIRKGYLSAFKVGNGKTSSYRIHKAEVQRLAMINLEKIIDDKVLEKIKEAK